jgi:hypothetical protein
MPKISTFEQLAFPLPTNSLTCQGEKLMSHALASRVFWDGGVATGVGDPPTVDITGVTHHGSNIIPANFFSTYRSILAEAILDVSGLSDGGIGFFKWSASTGGGPEGPNVSIPWSSATYGFDADDKTAAFKLRLVVDGTGLASLMSFITAKDDYSAENEVGLVRYDTQPFDGSLSGVTFATPITLALSFSYAQVIESGFPQPVCLFSRISF